MSVQKITWDYGTDTNLKFDPLVDKLDFGWMPADQFNVTQSDRGVLISIMSAQGTSNKQTYTLDGVSISQIQPDGIIALDHTTSDFWSDAISKNIDVPYIADVNGYNPSPCNTIKDVVTTDFLYDNDVSQWETYRPDTPEMTICYASEPQSKTPVNITPNYPLLLESDLSGNFSSQLPEVTNLLGPQNPYQNLQWTSDTSTDVRIS